MFLSLFRLSLLIIADIALIMSLVVGPLMSDSEALWELGSDQVHYSEFCPFLTWLFHCHFPSLPSSFQQRLSYTTLSDLALVLIDGTVYEIVQGLLDIQHLTERNLYNQRQKLHGEHRGLCFFMTYALDDGVSGLVHCLCLISKIRQPFSVIFWSSPQAGDGSEAQRSPAGLQNAQLGSSENEPTGGDRGT